MTLDSKINKTVLYLERYHPDSANILEDNLMEAQQNIVNFIGENTDQRKIKKFVTNEMNFAFDGIEDEVIRDVENIVGTTWDSMGSIMAQGFVTDTLAKSFKDFKDIDKLTKSRLVDKNKLIQGHTIDNHFKHLNTTSVRKIQGAISDGFANGSGIEEINRNIRNTIGSVNRNQARTVIRTTMLESLEDAKNEALEHFEDDILEWKFSAALDSRTSKYCFLHNGYTTKDKSKAKYRPKTHYQCRSMWLPVTELSKKLDENSTQNLVQWNGKKVNHRDGTKSTKFKVGEVKKVSRDATPEQVFNSFDKDYQIKFMGKKRYELYSSGKMQFNEAFNISRGKMLPLDKIEKRIAPIVKPTIVKPKYNENPYKNSTALEARERLARFSDTGVTGSNIGSIDLVNGMEKGIDDVMSNYKHNGQMLSIDSTSKNFMAAYQQVLKGEGEGRGSFKIGKIRSGFNNIEKSIEYSKTLYNEQIRLANVSASLAKKKILEGKKVPPIMQKSITKLKELELLKTNTKIWNTTDLASNEFEFGRIAFNHETWHKIDFENFLNKEFGEKISLRKIPATEIVKVSGYALSGGYKEMFAEVGALYSSGRKSMIPKGILDVFEEVIERVKK